MLAPSGEAGQACREALSQGAGFVIDADSLPASHYGTIYRRRAEHCARRDIRTVGFPEGLRRLADAGEQPVRLALVDSTQPPYHFQVFMAPDLSTVVACVGVAKRGSKTTPHL